MAQDYPVILVNPNNLADTLDLGDGTNYITNSAGLHDLPALAPILSDGYALGSVYVDTHYQPRQFSLTVTIRAGLSTGRPMRNAAHNTARDQLLRFLRKGRPVIVRTTYIGLGTWDILAIVQQVQWQPGTSMYAATLIAPDPRLISTTPQTQTEHLSSGSEHDFTLDAAGNCETRPTLTITPTAPKTNTWQYRRIYTVQNPTTDTDLKSEPIGLPFDFQWHIDNDRITSDGHDVRVLFNRAYIDRWFGNFSGGGGGGGGGGGTARYGVSVHLMRHSTSSALGLLDAYASQGLTYVRTDISWRNMEPSTKGSYDSALFTELSSIVAHAQSLGLHLTVTPIETPGWANGGGGAFVPPTNRQDYADFVGHVASVLSSHVGTFDLEIWNEPDEPVFWTTGPSAADYTDMLSRSYTAIKAVSSSIPVLGGSLSHNDQTFLSGMLTAGAGTHMDAVAVHPYCSNRSPSDTSNTGHAFILAITDTRTTLDGAGLTSMPIMLTEFGYTTAGGSAVSESTRATYLAALPAIVNAHTYVQGLAVFTPDLSNTEDTGYIVINGDGTPKTSYTAYLDALTVGGTGAGFIWVELDIPAGDTVTVEVIYGPNVTETWANKTDGPMFDMDLSSNYVARYLYTFMDVPGRPSTRTRQWNVHYAQSTGISAVVRHLFSPWHGSGTDTGTVNAAAGEVPLATRILGYAGLALHHPLKINNVTFSGFSQQTPTHEKLVLRALRPDISEEDDWELDDDTHTVLTAFGPFTVSFAESRLAIVFAMRSLSEHQEDLTPIAGADDVAVGIANPVVITGAANGTGNEEEIYMLQLRLWNRDTGTEIDLWNGFVTYNFGLGQWNSVTVDLETQALLMGPDNDSMIYALVLAPDVRGDYWWLEPGVNNLALSDAGTSGLDVAFAWQSARL